MDILSTIGLIILGIIGLVVLLLFILYTWVLHLVMNGKYNENRARKNR